VDDHLRPLVGRRLEQHRIEVGVRRHAGRQRLQRLRAADLAAIDGDRRIERHVLRLERRDAHAAAVQDAAQGGDQRRFAGVGSAALNHQAGGAALVHRRIRVSLPAIFACRPCFLSIPRRSDTRRASLPLAALAGAGLDRLLGEPRRWHPLVGFGALANAVESRLNRAWRRRLRGLLAWSCWSCRCSLWRMADSAGSVGWLLHVLLLALALGARSLGEHAGAWPTIWRAAI
jgi:hypothetical protein